MATARAKVTPLELRGARAALATFLNNQLRPGARNARGLREELARHALLRDPLLLDAAFSANAARGGVGTCEADLAAAVAAAGASAHEASVAAAALAAAMRHMLPAVALAYARAACSATLRDEARRLWERDAPAFLTDERGAGIVERDAEMACRMLLFDRDEALCCLEALLEGAHDDGELMVVVGEVLMAHSEPGADGAGVARSSLVANLMAGISALTKSIAATLAAVAQDPGEERDAARPSLMPSSAELFRLSCDVAHRARMARLLLLAFSRWQIALDSRGNHFLPGYSETFFGVAARRPAAAPADLGGELEQLIRLAREQSDCLWHCPDHSDANPLFELCYTLGLALMVALDFYHKKVDADSLAMCRDLRAGRFNRFLAETAALTDNLRRKFVDKLYLVRRPDMGGAVGADEWQHAGVKALVLLAGAHWFHGRFRKIACDPDDEALERSRPDGVHLGAIEGCPQAFAQAGGEPLARMTKVLEHMVEDALGEPGKALHVLSRVLASPSFARLPPLLRAFSTTIVHHVVTELVRLAACPTFPTVRGLLFRSRLQRLAYVKDPATGVLHPRPQARLVPSVATLPDCIEDLITLQAQLARAMPALACRYWCLRGAAAEPYTPPQNGDIGDGGDTGSSDDALDNDDDEGIDRGIGLRRHDDGVGVGVRAEMTANEARRLDPTYFLREVALLLRQDLRDACQGARVPAAAAAVAAASMTDEQAYFLPHSAAASAAQQQIAPLDGDSDLVSGRGDLRDATSDVANSVRLKRSAAKGFLALFADLLAALGSGPLCADGRSCAESLRLFLGGGGNHGRGHADSLLPVCLSFPDGLVSYLALAVAELDPGQQVSRGRRFERLHAAWERSRRAHQGDALARYVPVEVTSEPVPPDVRRPSAKVVQAVLRLVQALCLDGAVRDTLCGYAATLPDRAKDGRYPDRAEPDVYLRGMSGNNSFLEPDGDGDADSDAVPPTSLVHELLGLLQLGGAGVGLRTKSAALSALARAAEGNAQIATAVRDGLEASQVLRTLPAAAGGGNSDLRQELETVATADRYYEAQISFCELLRVLVAHGPASVPLHVLGRHQRVPGVLPHVRFVVEDVLIQHARRPLRPGCGADGWRVAFSALAVLLEVLRGYTVHHPASPVAVAAVDVARRGAGGGEGRARLNDPGADEPLLRLQQQQALADAPRPIPDGARRRGLSGLVLYALQLEPARALPLHEMMQMLRQAMGPIAGVAPPRLATLSEVCAFLAPLPAVARGGGRFRAWTSGDQGQRGQICIYSGGDPEAPAGAPVAEAAAGDYASCAWVLFESSAEGGVFAAPDFRVLVEQPVRVSHEDALAAQGFVAGDPRFDFCSDLPFLAVPAGRLGEPPERVIAPRSAGFDVMRRILSGGELMRCLLAIVVQAGCDGPSSAEGAAGLELAHERRDLASRESVRARHAALQAEVRGAEARRRGGDSVFRRMHVHDVALTTGGGHGLDFDSDREALHQAAEKAADEAAAPEVLAGMWGCPPTCEDTVQWREKVLCVALAVLNAALSHDEAFVRGARHPVLQADSLTGLPQLLAEVPAVPALVLRAVAYEHDPRIGVVAALLLFRLAVLRRTELPPGRLAAEVAAQCSAAARLSSREGRGGAATSAPLFLAPGVPAPAPRHRASTCAVEAIAETVLEDAGSSWREEARSYSARRRRLRLSDSLLAAARGGLEDVAVALVIRGAEANGRGLDGDTPLALACRRGMPRLAAALVARADVDLNGLGRAGVPPLVCAAESGRDQCAACVAQLLEGSNRADIEARNPGGETALVAALRTGARNCAALLVAAGADLHARDSRGRGVDYWLTQRIAQGEAWPNLQALAAGGAPALGGLGGGAQDPLAQLREDARVRADAAGQGARLSTQLWVRPPECAFPVVEAPISRLDGTSCGRSALGLGWADDRSDERERNAHARGARQSFLLELVLRSVEAEAKAKGTQSTGANGGPGASALSLGHVLLGFVAVPGGHIRLIAPSSPSGDSALPATVLSAIGGLLLDASFCVRRPAEAEAMARTLLALLRDASCAAPLLGFLAQLKAGREPVQVHLDPLRLARGHRVRLLGAGGGDEAEVLGPIGPPPAGEPPSSGAYRVRLASSGALRRVRAADLAPLELSAGGAHFLSSALAQLLPPLDGGDGERAADDESDLGPAFLPTTGVAGASAMLPAASFTAAASACVSAAVQQGLAFRALQAHLAAAVAAELQLIASAATAAVAAAAAADVAAATAAAVPPAASRRVVLQQALLGREQQLQLLQRQAVRDLAAISQALLAPGPSGPSAVLCALQALGSLLSVPAPEADAEVLDLLGLAVAEVDRLAGAARGAAPEPGFAVAGGVGDPFARPVVPTSPPPAPTRAALGLVVQLGPGGPRVQTYDVHVLRALLAAVARRVKSASPCLQRRVLVWAELRNAYVLGLAASLQQARALSMLVRTMWQHCLPEPDPAAREPMLDAATQQRQLEALLHLVRLVLVALGANAAELLHAAAPSLLLVPLAELLLTLLHAMRTGFPSVRTSADASQELVRDVARLTAARCAAAGGGDCSDELDAGAALQLRALLYACLLELTHYCFGAQPHDAATLAAAVADAAAEAADAARGWSATPPPQWRSAAHVPLAYPRLAAAPRDECARGWAEAVRAEGPALAQAAVSDACGLSPHSRAQALLLLAALLQPPARGAALTASGAVSLPGLAALPRALEDQLADSQEAVMRALASSGSLRGLLRSLCVADADEARLGVAAVQPFGSAPPAWASLPGADGDSAALYSVRTVPAADLAGLGHLQLEWRNGDGAAALDTADDGGRAETAQVAARTWLLAARAVLAAALVRKGAAALLQSGLFAALHSLTWPRRFAQELLALRAQGAGLQFGSVGESAEAHGGVDGAVAAAVAAAAPRLEALLAVLAAALLARPGDRGLAAEVCAWLAPHAVLLDLAAQAALAPRTHIACLSVAAAFVGLLQSLAPRLPASLAPGDVSGGFDVQSCDRVVLRLFQRYAPQPRGDVCLRAAAAAAAQLEAQQVQAHMMRGLGETPAQAPQQLLSWLQTVVPQPHHVAERRWLATPLSAASAARVEPLVRTAFAVHALGAGERLACAISEYCRARCLELLPGRLGVALPQPQLQPHGHALLFRAPDALVGDALRLAATPTVRALLEAIEQAAQAFVHARRQAAAALAQSQRATPPQGGLRLDEAAVAACVARDAQNSALRSYESYVVVLLVHAIAEPALRLSDAAAVERFERLPAVAEATSASEVAGLLFVRLRELCL